MFSPIVPFRAQLWHLFEVNASLTKYTRYAACLNTFLILVPLNGYFPFLLNPDSLLQSPMTIIQSPGLPNFCLILRISFMSPVCFPLCWEHLSFRYCIW
ncbi:hypothetical protein P9112_004146 [Eukaryota sp. TZLM1-RC]